MSEVDCQELEGAIVAVADGSASADEAAAVRAHITTCAACARELADARALLAGVRAADPPPERPQAFWDELHAGVMARVAPPGRDELAAARARKQEREARPMGRVAWIASAVAVAAVIAFYVVRMTGSGSGSGPESGSGLTRAPHEEVAPLALEEDDELDELDQNQLEQVDEALEEQTGDALADLSDIDPDDEDDVTLEELDESALEAVYARLNGG